MGVLAAADQVGAQVPGQLSVIGFDDIQSAALLGLSTVRQPLEDSGAQGAERLCALLRGEPVRPRRQVLEVQVVPRATTGRPGPRRASRPPSAATSAVRAAARRRCGRWPTAAVRGAAPHTGSPGP